MDSRARLDRVSATDNEAPRPNHVEAVSQPATEQRPEKRRKTPTEATLVSIAKLSPSMVRVHIAAEMAPIQATDAYVKFVFHKDEGSVMRSFTVRDWIDGGFIADAIVHSDGTAGAWFDTAVPGAALQLRGPGGSFIPSTDAGVPRLLVVDLSALPAAEASLAAMPHTARGTVLIHADSPEEERAIDAPENVAVRWIIAEQADAAAALTHELASIERDANTEIFVHGEAGWVRNIRRELTVNWGIDTAKASLSGYWMHGKTDEEWRDYKGEWRAAVDQAEEEARERFAAERRASDDATRER